MRHVRVPLSALVLLLVLALIAGCSSATPPPATGEHSAGAAAPGVAQPGAEPAIPAAAELPAGDPDAAALTLAARARGEGEPALAAYLTAMRASGVTVTGREGAVLAAPESDGGWRLPARYLRAMTGSSSQQLPLDLVARVLTTAGAPQGNGPSGLTDGLVAALQAMAEGEDPQRRFFARFVAGLAADSAPDLLLVRSTRALVLSTPQSVLVLLPLLAEIEGRAASAGVAPVDLAPEVTAAGGTAAATVAPAAWRAVPAKADHPCEPGWEDTLGKTNGWVQQSLLSALLEKAGRELTKKVVEALLKAADLVIDLLEFVMAREHFRATFELEGGTPPLVRTKDRVPPQAQFPEIYDGESRVVKVTFGYRPSVDEATRCRISAARRLGVMLPKPPPSGPLDGTTVVWTNGENLSSAGGASPIRYGKVLGEQPKTGPKGPLHGLTDANGVARVEVWGRAQRAKVPDWAPKVTKQFGVVVKPDLRGDSSWLAGVEKAWWAMLKGPLGAIVDVALSGLKELDGKGRVFPYVDYARDLRVDYQAGPTHVSGTICGVREDHKGGSVAARGTITMTGKVAAGSGTVAQDGTVEVTLRADGTGKAKGTFASSADFLDKILGKVGLTSAFDAKVRIVPAGDGKPSGKLVVDGGKVTGSAGGSAPGVAIHKEFSAGSASGTMPVEFGDYCSK